MDFISLILCILCLVLISKTISTLHYLHALWQRYKNIPRKTILPFIDETCLLLMMSPPDRARKYETLNLDEKYKEARDKEIAITWTGFNPIIHIVKLEYVEILTSSIVNIQKGIPYNMLQSWLGNGLLTSTGTQWVHDRKLIGPTFHFSILEDFAAIMSEKAELLTKRLEKEIEKREEAIDFFPFAVDVALDIICETIMGVNIHAQEAENEYCQITQRMTHLIIERTCRPWVWHDWIYYLTSAGKEYRAGIRKLHEFTNTALQVRRLIPDVFQVISKKKAARRSQDSCTMLANGGIDLDTGRRKKNTFLDLLLDLNETDDTPLTDDELKAQVDTFMFAGHDTTAAAITWTLLCLGSNLEHQEKVHEELERVFKDSQAPASTKELSQLKYLDRVIKETLRLFPSVPMITRKLTEDIKLGDYSIERGVTIIIPIILIHKNPQVWPNPMKFDPDRFLPENTKHRNPCAYMPFSAGPRNCIGQKFALLEEKTVLTAILRKWRVKSLKTIDDVKYTFSIVTRPWDKIFIDFTPKRRTAGETARA